MLEEKGAAAVATEKLSDRPWLGEPLAAGQAVVWYLGHSGWVVKTQNHLLIFDYWKQDVSPTSRPWPTAPSTRWSCGI